MGRTVLALELGADSLTNVIRCEASDAKVECHRNARESPGKAIWLQGGA